MIWINLSYAFMANSTYHTLICLRVGEMAQFWERRWSSYFGGWFFLQMSHRGSNISHTNQHSKKMDNMNERQQMSAAIRGGEPPTLIASSNQERIVTLFVPGNSCSFNRSSKFWITLFELAVFFATSHPWHYLAWMDLRKSCSFISEKLNFDWLLVDDTTNACRPVRVLATLCPHDLSITELRRRCWRCKIERRDTKTR